MGTGLITYGDALLEIDGVLADDLACCDYCDEDECPACCSKITSGALIDGEIKIFSSVGSETMEITIVTPSGTRLVCADQIISITLEFTGDEPYIPAISWDPAWKYAGHTPAIDTSGFLDESGLVDWGFQTGNTFTLNLKYAPCLIEGNPSLGLIQVSGVAGDEDIELSHCPGGDCCEVLAQCEPCCWELVGGVFDEDSGTFIYYAEAANFWVVVEVNIAQPEKRLTCKDDSVSISVRIGSRNRETLESHTFNVEVTIEGFGYASATPAPPTTEPVVGEPGSVVWSGNLSRNYSVEGAAECGVREPGSFTIQVADAITFASITPIVVGFVECPKPEGCDCCCRHCCDDCHFPVSEDVCEEPKLSAGSELGGPTQIENLTFQYDYDPPVMCQQSDDDGGSGYTVPVSQIIDTQEGLSTHATMCEDICDGAVLCGKSRCFFFVTVPTTSCDNLDGPKFNNVYTVSYAGAGVWSIHPGYTINGDCNGASGEIVIGNLTLTISFTVSRSGEQECPLPEE